MKHYTVNQLAQVSGITVRTLHYYDEIDLLKPSFRSEAGHRKYTKQDLILLQQILLYREFNVPLSEIKQLITSPNFEVITTLEKHKTQLENKRSHYKKLINHINTTVKKLKKSSQLVTEKDLYEGFSKEQITKYNREVIEKYGKDEFDAVHKRLKMLSKNEWQQVKDEGENIAKELAKYIDTNIEAPEVQKIIQRHLNWIENFYSVSKEKYTGLANLYRENEEFSDYYNKYSPNLANFLSKAMCYFAEKNL